MIRVAELRSCVTNGHMIEEYPEDVRGHSCLILSYGDDGRPILSGNPILRQGDPNEVCTLSRRDATLNGALSR